MAGPDKRRVIEQFKVRLPAAPIEVMWALGRPVSIDVQPPDWVKNAVQRMAKELNLLQGSAEGKATPYLVGEYNGLVTTAIAAAECPSEEEQRQEITNRRLWALRYQPSAGLIVNSPVQTPSLAAKVRSDWAGLTSAQLRSSLLKDASVPATETGAFRRLRFYFPEEYKKQKLGALAHKIEVFESKEKTSANR